jgi:hypothetical protein
MNTDQDIERLKASTRRLEAKLKDLIERSPVLRRAQALAELRCQTGLTVENG